MAEIGHVMRDAATDAFWAGRWSGMASALARALRSATTGEAELLAEYARLAEQFECPPFFVSPARPSAEMEEWDRTQSGLGDR